LYAHTNVTTTWHLGWSTCRNLAHYDVCTISIYFSATI
jgi:hypothetical protein